MTTNVKILTTTLYAGIIKTKACAKSVEMTEIIVLLISKKNTMTDDVTTEVLV